MVLFSLVAFVAPKKSVGNKVKLTPEQCVANAGQYNGKVLNIKGESIVGKIEIVGNSKDCRLEAYYVLAFDAELVVNKYNETSPNYNYAGLTKKDTIKDRKYYRSTGSITPVQTNVGKLPTSAKDFQATSLFYRPNTSVSLSDQQTTHFYNTFSIYQDLTEEGYRDLFNYNWFGIVDLKPYISQRDLGNGMSESVTDYDKAYLNGNIVKEFKFIVSE